MKKGYFVLLAVAAFLTTGCVKELEQFEGDGTSVRKTFTAGFGESTKTTVDETGKVSWSQGDVVRYYSTDGETVGECTIAEDCDGAVLTMDIATDATYLAAVYGGTSLSENTGSGMKISGAIPAEQTGSFGDSHLAAVKISDMSEDKLTFYNIASYVKFTLERTDVFKVVFRSNDGTAITGDGEVNLTFSDDDMTASFGSSKSSFITVNNGGSGTFYIATLPCVLTTGFTADCYDTDGNYLGSAVSDKRVLIQHGRILNLGVIDSHIENICKDLSAAGTANCYIVPSVGNYKFNATVQGSSSTAIEGTPAKAVVLWESFGTSTAPNKGDVVSNVAYANGFVNFTSGKDGNAVIAVEDASDNILWSWHIWVSEGYNAETSAQLYSNNMTVMDRNIGALSAGKGDVKALGLMYQWGRKDPFLGGSSISYWGWSNQTKAVSTNSWPSAVSLDASTGTNAYAVANPMTFITSGGDWNYSNDESRWAQGGGKGVYDPCPAGYRVPDGGVSGLWANILGITMWKTDGNWDGTNCGVDFALTDKKLSNTASSVWYPAAGLLNPASGDLNSVGTEGGYWARTTQSGYGNYFYMASGSGIKPAGVDKKATGFPVRCCRDENYVIPETPATDLSTDGTANSYIVSKEGKYKIPTVKGNSDISVGEVASAEVLWESYGTDTAPVSGDLVNGVTYSEGYITFYATAKKGNAVIAAKDASGNTLWSWHIWMTDKPVDQVYNNNAGTMMDRNLGATSATPGDFETLGLLYQWGRKDPFLGVSSFDGTTRAASTITWPSNVPSDPTNGTIAYATANPTTFIASNSNNYDWYYSYGQSTDNTRWGSDKTMYDPCPAGYRVPDGEKTGIWAKAFGSYEEQAETTLWDSANHGMDFGGKDMTLGTGTIWYPTPGMIQYYGGKVSFAGIRGYYWSCTGNAHGYTASFMFCGNTQGCFTPTESTNRSYGMSVRCCKE